LTAPNDQHPTRMPRLARRLSPALLLAPVFACAFAVRSLYTVPLGPLMYTPMQPGTRMAWRYHDTAESILRGDGILWPREPDPAHTGLMARPPGYSMFLAAVYGAAERSFFAAQFVQNLLTSMACVLLALATALLVRWSVGFAAGLLAALSPHIALPSSFLLPDALSALPLMTALLVLALASRGRAGLWWSTLAGALLGVATWLRPNVVLLAPCLAALVFLLARNRRRAVWHGAAVLLSAALVVLPITVRNYVVFHELVPVSLNGGLTFLQGVADAGGEPYGARRHDKLVMEDEAIRYGNPRYRDWWAEPDGVFRDRERYRRAREVIRAHPGLYARVVLRRMGQMLDYWAGDAPTVAADAFGDPPAADKRTHDLGRRPSDDRYLAPGRALEPLRTPVGWLQQLLVWLQLPLVLLGTVLLLALDWRRTACLLAIPLYYLCTESFFLYEWRVATPMHYALLGAAAAGLVLPLGVLWRAVRGRNAKGAESATQRDGATPPAFGF
jgi:hypothetical protein